MSTIDSTLTYFQSFLTDHKRDLFDQVLAERTRHLTVVLEDLFHPHNASAVLRNCDGFGIQDIHIIEKNHRFTRSRDIDRGAHKWLNLYRYNHAENSASKCFSQLKTQNYQVVALSPSHKAIDLDKLDLNKKTALVFGAEKHGLTSYTQTHADAIAKIPMRGFTESFNVSVSVAVALHHLTQKLRRSKIPWAIDADQGKAIKMLWTLRSIRSPRTLLREYLKKNPEALSQFDFSEFLQ